MANLTIGEELVLQEHELIHRNIRSWLPENGGSTTSIKPHSEEAGHTLSQGAENAPLSLEQENERLRKEINAKQAEINAKQAEIDRLMLEFCPDEMTEEQKAEWAARQRPA